MAMQSSRRLAAEKRKNVSGGGRGIPIEARAQWVILKSILKAGLSLIWLAFYRKETKLVSDAHPTREPRIPSSRGSAFKHTTCFNILIF
jgi:hypothetical protein